MKTEFPQTWQYFKANEKAIRARDKGKMNDKEGWYGYTRPMNLEKMDKPKLGIAQTVTHMAVFYDEKGEVATNNVRVGGILASNHLEARFIQGILNAPVCDFVFKRIAKAKDGGYFEANKQFLLPLPIPHATNEQKAQVAEKAKHLQTLHTKRRDLLLMIDKRLDSSQCENDKRNEGWLWADVKPVAAIKKEAPPELKGKELTDWAKFQRELKLVTYMDGINPMLRPGAKLTIANEYGELKLMANGAALIEGIFLDEDEAPFIAAQWRQKARKTNVTEKFDAKRLLGLLLKLRKTENEAIRKQVVQIDADIQILDEEIASAEADMNALTYRLYGLTEDEVRLVVG